MKLISVKNQWKVIHRRDIITLHFNEIKKGVSIYVESENGVITRWDGKTKKDEATLRRLAKPEFLGPDWDNIIARKLAETIEIQP